MISIVIGSWGSYNECNERALGSKWLKLADYECWEDILDELESEGFDLDGIDEETEKRHQEFLDYIQYLIDHPQPNRNIHDFESED